MTALTAAGAFAERDLRVALSYRAQFAIGALGSAMSLVIFRFIAELVGDSDLVPSAGGYFAFVVVGMMLYQVLETAVTAPGAAARQEQVQGTLEILAARPLSAAGFATGWSTFPVLRSLIDVAVILGLAVAMGFRPERPAVVPALVALVLAAIAFAGLGLIGAALVVAFQQGGRAAGWVASGLALLSGAYFPTTLMPEWVRALGMLSPMTHALAAVRGTLLDGEGFGAVAGDLAALTASALVLVPAGVLALDAALRRARAAGTIGLY